MQLWKSNGIQLGLDTLVIIINQYDYNIASTLCGNVVESGYLSSMMHKYLFEQPRWIRKLSIP